MYNADKPTTSTMETTSPIFLTYSQSGAGHYVYAITHESPQVLHTTKVVKCSCGRSLIPLDRHAQHTGVPVSEKQHLVHLRAPARTALTSMGIDHHLQQLED